MPQWNAEQYLKFKAERTQPSVDLSNRITVRNPRRILDLGCGPGNSTRILKERFPNAEVILGIDSSSDMIERARREQPELSFQTFDLRDDLTVLGRDWDVVFSNACLHWIPDHRALLPKLLKLLAPKGQLAVQIPLTEDAVFYRICAELHASEPWKSILPGEMRSFHQLKPIEYCDVLAECAAEFSVWETVYHHLLPDFEAVVEWYRGSGLRPYLECLPETRREEFISAILERVRNSYLTLKDGRVLVRFPRFFFIANKT